MKGATLVTVGVAILIALVAVPVGVWAQGMWGPGGWWGFPGQTKAEEGTPFYGYFTFDFERNGKAVGMASVNAFTGQVWYHTWHGTFIREKHL